MTARRHSVPPASPWDVEVRVGRDLEWAGLAVASRTVTLEADDVERIVVPLEGDAHVRSGGVGYELRGRESVFEGAADSLFLPAGSPLELRTAGRVAIASAPAARGRSAQLLRAADVPVEARGAGGAQREVRNFGTPDVVDAERLIVCEVVTRAGHWSSYPAHKHDVDRLGVESALEEIYLFEARALPPADGLVPFGLFACEGTGDGEDELTLVVRSGDVVLVPSGYHGPAAAPPDADLYYLNVMAGQGPERRWLIADDPRQTAVRAAWAAPDERSRR